MQKNEQVNDSASKLYIILITLVIVIILMANLVGNFKNAESSAGRVNFNLIAKQFEQAVQLSHLLWLQQGKPTKVLFRGQSQDIVDEFAYVSMNKLGWPSNVKTVSELTVQSCEQTWQQLLAVPLKSLRQKINVNLSKEAGKLIYCHYSVNNEQSFYYQPDSGQILIQNTLAIDG
ncbi:hypothetical protein HR060_03200 [Catenovulum sp. SM1970]|uniref:hypothetical protein n=1 Tax=Marinifaba aquimaris TaxID=2741323 RepID=UPI001574C4FB|nr:hypothetical protein [Marinifaba aquimaris]NTS75864.1 hypothetical protein [Marinifaba aquimaris]